MSTITLRLCTAFVWTVFVSIACVAASSAGGPAPAAPQAKLVDETRKNIQVLKGLPEAQLFPLMNFVSDSLGVRCEYCHVEGGGPDKWKWESDEKPTKQTARRMMQMVVALNAEHAADFRGGDVTCYTCHRGERAVARLPKLPLAASAHEPATAPPAKAPEALPTAAEVFDRYVAAVGGRDAVANVRTIVLKGTREASQGRVWPVEIAVKEPGRYMLTVTIPQQGVIQQAVVGPRGWIKTPREQHEANASELEAMGASAALYDPLKVAAPAAGAAVVGREAVGGRDAYVVESKRAAGAVARFYFDVETGLLVRMLVVTKAAFVPIPEQTDFEDYREVGGVKLPYTIRTSNVDTYSDATRRFSEIQVNVPVDDSRFDMPAAPAK
jgi:hypothetical protein